MTKSAPKPHPVPKEVNLREGYFESLFKKRKVKPFERRRTRGFYNILKNASK